MAARTVDAYHHRRPAFFGNDRLVLLAHALITTAGGKGAKTESLTCARR